MAKARRWLDGSLLEALGCTEKYVTSATLTWSIGKPVELSVQFFPTDEAGNPMLDPSDNERVLEATKKYKLTEIVE